MTKITTIEELDKAIENWEDNEDIQRVFEAWKADKIAIMEKIDEWWGNQPITRTERSIKELKEVLGGKKA